MKDVSTHLIHQLAIAALLVGFATLARAEDSITPPPDTKVKVGPRSGAKQTGEPSISVVYAELCEVKDYGQMLTVYGNIENNRGNNNMLSPARSDRYFFVPRPVVKRAVLRRRLAELKLNLGARASGDPIADFDIPVSFDLDEVATEIAAALTKRFASTPAVDPQQVEAVPLNGYQIYWAPIPGTSQIQVLYSLPENQAYRSADLKLVGFNTDPFDVRLHGRLSQIEAFIARPSLGAVAFVAGAETQTAAVRINADYMASDEFETSLNGDASLTSNFGVSHSEGSGGFGLSFAGVSLGGQGGAESTSGSASVTRFVSRNCIVNALRSSKARLAIQEFVTGDQNIDSIVNTLIQFATDNLTHFDADFQANGDRGYKLVSSVVNDAICPDFKVSDMAAITKGVKSLSDSDKQSVTYAGVKAEDDKNFGLTNNSDITWKAGDGLEVPSSIRLYAYSKDAMSRALQASYFKSAVHFKDIIFETCSSVTQEEAEIIPSEIGTIIASVMPWDKMGKEFRHDWRPADGSVVDVSTLYYKLMAKNGVADAVVKLPDLRGEFLRGLNGFGGGMAAVDRDPFDKEQRRARIPGLDEESDAMQRATYTVTINGALNPPQFLDIHMSGDSGRGDHYSPRDDNNNSPLVITASGVRLDDYETRPRNVAVFYYIRVN